MGSKLPEFPTARASAFALPGAPFSMARTAFFVAPRRAPFILPARLMKLPSRLYTADDFAASNAPVVNRCYHYDSVVALPTIPLEKIKLASF